MSKSLYRNVHVSMWGDAKFRALSDDGKLLWLYLLTGPETTAAPGCISVGRAALAEGLEWETDRLDRAFAELDRFGMARADWKARFVWLPNATKYITPAAWQHVKGWLPYLQVLPECPLKDRAIGALWRYIQTRSKEAQDVLVEAFGKPYLDRCERLSDTAPDTAPDTLSNTVSDRHADRAEEPYPIQDQDQDQDQDQERSPPLPPPQAGGGDEEPSSGQPKRSRKKRELSEAARTVRAEIAKLVGVEYPPATFDALEARFRAKDFVLDDALLIVRHLAGDRFWGGEVKLAPDTIFRPSKWPRFLAQAKAHVTPKPNVRPIRPEDDDVYARLL